MIKVVEAISDTNIGGAGILLLNRLKNTDANNFSSVVVLPKGSLLAERFKEQGIITVEINGCRDRSFDFFAIFEYLRILKNISPHIINSHGCLSFRIAAKIARVPIKIYTRHCVFPVKRKNAFLKMLRGAFSVFLSDHIIAVAHAAKENLLELGIKNNDISVIINGAERLRTLSEKERQMLRDKYGIGENEKVITICARLEPYKDHICFLNAAKLLSERQEKYRFFVVGGGSLEKKLKEYASENGLKERVIFTGHVNDVSPFLNITDVNVNCSIGTETSSLALSEGMSIGVPLVVSNYGGNPYMVCDGGNGYWYRAGDPRDLAIKIQKIALADKKVYERMSFECRKRFANELNAEQMTKSTQTLYLELYKKMKPRR